MQPVQVVQPVYVVQTEAPRVPVTGTYVGVTIVFAVLAGIFSIAALFTPIYVVSFPDGITTEKFFPFSGLKAYRGGQEFAHAKLDDMCHGAQHAARGGIALTFFAVFMTIVLLVFAVIQKNKHAMGFTACFHFLAWLLIVGAQGCFMFLYFGTYCGSDVSIADAPFIDAKFGPCPYLLGAAAWCIIFASFAECCCKRPATPTTAVAYQPVYQNAVEGQVTAGQPMMYGQPQQQEYQPYQQQQAQSPVKAI